MVGKPRRKCAVNPSCTLYKKLFLKKIENFFQKVWRLQNKVVTLHRKTQTNIFQTKKSTQNANSSSNRNRN